MKWLLVSFLALCQPVHAADLSKDLEILKVQMRLDEMWREDQAFREGLDTLVKKGYPRAVLMNHPAFGDKWKKVSSSNIEELKKIFQKWGWPTISAFGRRADEQAYSLVEHAEHDLAFQELALGALEKALETRDTQPAHFAVLWDRVKVAKHLPQRYGTQGACRGKGIWEPFAMEDPATVNRRRHAMGLEPLDEAKLKNNRTCYFSPNLNE